nr:MAG TPA: hypothetical protein [Caudoviricetes sp.]
MKPSSGHASLCTFMMAILYNTLEKVKKGTGRREGARAETQKV